VSETLPTSLTLRRTRLVRVDPDGTVAEYIFDQPSVTLGAMDDNDLVLDDDRVSRYHARIYLDGDDFLIEDLRSLTGTWVNRVRVRDAFLKSGCSIRLGNTNLRFSVLNEKVDIQPSQHEALSLLVGRSELMRRVMAVVEKVAPTGATVVLEGETGTGKEVVARTLHQLSPRAAQPFIVFDCGAVQPNLIESELFGHEKGSFTGALAARQGLFEVAHGGTLFLDEIGELHADLQPKLLRALEQREVRRVGGNRPIKIDARVLAATNRDLEGEVREGRFREDLFYRLGVVRVRLPALRERREDIELLVRDMLRAGSFNRGPDGQARVKGISHDALQALFYYEWPGNVRELGNVVERACSFAEGDLLQLDDLPDHISGFGKVRARPKEALPTEPLRPTSAGLTIPVVADQPFKEAKESVLTDFERHYLATVLQRHSGNLSQAARVAEVDRKHFRRLARKYNLLPSRPEETEDDEEAEE
jgi:DNA-binding NtrC family response regulator